MHTQQAPQSPVHQLDPGARLLGACIVAASIAVAQSPVAVFWALLFILPLPVLARLRMRYVLRSVLLVNIFIGFLWITLALAAWLQAELSMEAALTLAVLISLKANTLVLLFMALPGTLSIAELGYALHSLKVPAKLIYLLVFTYRAVFILHEQIARMRAALTARCFTIRLFSLHTWQTLACMLAMLVLHSLDRADRVQQALLCRGFSGQFPSCIQTRKIQLRDLVFILAMSAFAIVLSIPFFINMAQVILSILLQCIYTVLVFFVS